MSGPGAGLGLIDTHCHLDQLPDAAVDEAADAGVTTIVAVAQEAASMRAVLDLAQRYPGRVLAGLGIHPCTVTRDGLEALAPDLDLLRARAGEATVIGETGLDHKWATTEAQQAEQDRALDVHFEVAAQHGMPVNLHSRRCLRLALQRAVDFHRQTGLNAQMHWFTHSKKLVRISNDEGIYVSAGPSILHDEQALATACEVADDLLLLETDAPVRIRGFGGHPRRVRDVAEKLAAARGVALETLAARVEDNWQRYLRPG